MSAHDDDAGNVCNCCGVSFDCHDLLSPHKRIVELEAKLAEERACYDCREYREMMEAKLAEKEAEARLNRAAAEKHYAESERLRELHDAHCSMGCDLALRGDYVVTLPISGSTNEPINPGNAAAYEKRMAALEAKLSKAREEVRYWEAKLAERKTDCDNCEAEAALIEAGRENARARGKP